MPVTVVNYRTEKRTKLFWLFERIAPGPAGVASITCHESDSAFLSRLRRVVEFRHKGYSLAGYTVKETRP